MHLVLPTVVPGTIAATVGKENKRICKKAIKIGLQRPSKQLWFVVYTNIIDLINISDVMPASIFSLVLKYILITDLHFFRLLSHHIKNLRFLQSRSEVL